RAAVATVLDGIPGRNKAAAQELAEILCHLGNKSEALEWAKSFLATLPELPCALVGWGGLTPAQEQELQRLLVSKGVPQDAVGARLQAAVAKLGPGPLAGALSQKNVWQALKAAASRPGTPFKWVQPDELQAHIELKAQTKFGTEVRQPRAKKQRASRSLAVAPLHIDPTQLMLSPGSFVSKSGSPLGQISFAEVQACATGICFCTSTQATPFLEAAKNLSVDALALVTTSEIEAHSYGLANASPLRFPALYAPTQEAILVTGTLIQLGDEEVQLSVADIAEVENLSTVVCRLSVYKDECKLPWERFTE
ncbi:RTase, partial [Symbiodinium necroappetens]